MSNNLNLSNEDIQFLKELSKELREQSHDCQASPRFWVVGDYEWRRTSDGEGERRSIYIPDDAECWTLDDYVDYIKEEYDKLDNELKELIDNYQSGLYLSQGEIEEYILENIHSDAYFFDEQKVHVTKPNTMFLTKQACKDHIKANHYHYTKEAHTYAMTAFRSPKVEKLLSIIQNIQKENVECQ